MTELPEVLESRVVPGWELSKWADRLVDQAGLGITILNKDGHVMYWNQWAGSKLDRNPGYLGTDVRDRHKRRITNPRFDAMLKLFTDGRTEPVHYVARPYGGISILVIVSPIRVDGELLGYSQFVLMKDQVQDLFNRFNETGRESFQKDMLPDVGVSAKERNA